jgi:GTP1/Obg family GTP-binding protein
MLDWEGNMVTKKDQVQVLLSEVAEDTALAASVQISNVENVRLTQSFRGAKALQRRKSNRVGSTYQAKQIQHIGGSVPDTQR